MVERTPSVGLIEIYVKEISLELLFYNTDPYLSKLTIIPFSDDSTCGGPPRNPGVNLQEIGSRSNRYELRRSAFCRVFAWWKVMEEDGRKPSFVVFEWVRVFFTFH